MEVNSLISIFLAFIFAILFVFLYIKIILIFGKIMFKKRGNRKGVKMIDKVDTKMKYVWNYSVFLFGVFIKMIFSALLAIGIKPIILKLNYPLGEGYATFASYIVAICLYLIIPDLWEFPKEDGKNAFHAREKKQ